MKMRNQFVFLEPPIGSNLWNDRRDGKWKPWEECVKGEDVAYGDFVGMRSYKAAKRYMRKHDEIPKGMKFRLCSRWIGYDRELVKK